MAFGKGKYLESTNQSAGYALWAILVDHNEGSSKDPIEVCDKLQDGSKSTLLSGLVSIMDEYFEVKLHYNLNSSANSTDVKLCIERGAKVSEYENGVNLSNIFNPDSDYYMVLVEDNHWIAVKRKKKEENTGKFSIYDPVYKESWTKTTEELANGNFGSMSGVSRAGLLVIALKNKPAKQ